MSKKKAPTSKNSNQLKSKLKNVAFLFIILWALWEFTSSVDVLYQINSAKSFLGRNSVIFGGLCLLGLITLGVLILVTRRTNAKYDALYDEMRSSLRSVMLPLGFKEKESKSDMRHPTVSFSRGKLSVVLWWNYREQCYCVDGSSKESIKERQARIQDLTARATTLKDDEFREAMEELENEQNDFSVEGDISDSKFKANVLAELNKWLFRQGIK